MSNVLGGKVRPITQILLENAVGSTRKRSIVLAIDDLIEDAARRRMRSIARVTAAVALTAEQETTLADKLTTMYGKQISLRVAIDPAIKGGLIIRIGDELIDGSVSHRMSAARAALAG